MVKWQNDEGFVEWLYLMEYAVKTDKGPKPYMSIGVVIYMHEAWTAGRKGDKGRSP